MTLSEIFDSKVIADLDLNLMSVIAQMQTWAIK